jgi:hypothetical protein
MPQSQRRRRRLRSRSGRGPHSIGLLSGLLAGTSPFRDATTTLRTDDPPLACLELQQAFRESELPVLAACCLIGIPVPDIQHENPRGVGKGGLLTRRSPSPISEAIIDIQSSRHSEVQARACSCNSLFFLTRTVRPVRLAPPSNESEGTSTKRQGTSTERRYGSHLGLRRYNASR